MSKVIIINNQVIISEGIKSILHSQSEIEVVATGGISDTIQLVDEHRPDTILFQLESTNFYIIDIIRNVIEKHPNTKFLIMYEKLKTESLKELIEIGVVGFIEPLASPNELIKAINRIQEGHSYVPNYIIDLVMPDYQRLLLIKGKQPFIQLEVRKPFHLLTPKECETLQLLASGHSNRMIADTMGISEKTTKNHVSSILVKMDVRDRTQAVLKALKNGWVHLN